MGSEFRKQKLLRLLRLFFDTENNGSVTKQDFIKVTEKVAAIKGLAADDPKLQKVQEALLKIWSLLQTRAGCSDDGSVSEAEWISTWENVIKNPSIAAEWHDLFCKFIFKFMDTGDDGTVDEAEYIAAYSIYDVNAEHAGEAFRKASKGKDTISFEDFQSLFMEYFISDDPDAPGCHIFGTI